MSSKLDNYGITTCYRVTSNHKLEISTEYATLKDKWFTVFDSSDLIVKAYDMLIISWEEKEYLIVAIGESGILRRELPDGNWVIIGVLNARNR
jgi:hypothetical protein